LIVFNAWSELFSSHQPYFEELLSWRNSLVQENVLVNIQVFEPFSVSFEDIEFYFG
jgi:hypothetical protein